MFYQEQHASAMDARRVTAALEATGSSDPDVLFGRKQELLAHARRPNAAALAEIIGGVALSATIVGAFLGVPAIGRGLARRKSIAQSLKVVESAYCAYLESVNERSKNKF